MAGLDNFATGSLETAVAFAAGFALGRALEPVGTKLAQDAYAGHPDKALAAELVATLRAEGMDSVYAGDGEAAMTGVSADRLAAIVQTVLTGPGIADALTMLRRGTITDAQAIHALRKAKREAQYDAATLDLRNERLDPAVIATAVQRGLMHDPGLLVVGPPSETGKVPPMPTVDLDTLVEAAASGIDHDRLAVLARMVGLPASPDLAARMVFRQIIEPVDFDRAIAEGNTRNEWAPFLFEAFREILTAHDYIEARLRGWIDDAAMYAGTARHGMTKEDTDLLFKVTGRPLSFHQVWIGERRGGSYGGPTDQIDPAFLRQLEESNIRPEWYNLAWAQRYTLPSYFVFRAIVQAGGLTADEAAAYFEQLGWPPDLAKKAAAAFAHGAVAKADPHVTKAATQLWTTLHRSYVLEETDDTHAQELLTALGVAETAHTEILALWQHERDLVRKTLTQTQVKKAVGEGKFTRDEGLARLERLGLSAADADTYLSE